MPRERQVPAAKRGIRPATMNRLDGRRRPMTERSNSQTAKHPKERAMFTKIRTSMFAIAAVAALGAASLITTTTSADARGFGGGGGGFHGGGMGGGHAMRMSGGGMRMGGGVRMGHVGIRNVGIRHVNFRPVRHVHDHPNWCRFYGRCGIHVRWHRPWIYGTGVVATSYAVAPAIATAKPCTCLSKEYTPDNLVVFKDLCTKEVASAPIGNTQVQLQLPPQQDQAPQQQ